MQARPRISFIDKSGGSSVKGVLGLIDSTNNDATPPATTSAKG